jgi:hypothetical protein
MVLPIAGSIHPMGKAYRQQPKTKRIIQGRRPEPPIIRRAMAQNHYVTKRKRRPKNSNRKDPSHATMTKLRKLAAAEEKKS